MNHVGMSEFWLRKMRTLFATFDFDKDGFISEDDYAEMGRRFAEKQNADPEKKEKLTRTFVNLWRKYMKSATPEMGNRLTIDILVKSVCQQLYDPDLIIEIVGLLQGMFDLLDVNKDGVLQPEEHKILYDHLGVPEDRFDRRVAFDALDINQDGEISMKEFVSGFFDFFFSEDETSPRKIFYGPLVD